MKNDWRRPRRLAWRRLDAGGRLCESKGKKGHNLSFAGLVALSEVARPDPIPNSAVKRFSANGTLSQDTGE